VIDATQSIEVIHEQVKKAVLRTIEEAKGKPINKLWL